MTAPLSLRAFLDAANKLQFVDKAEFETCLTGDRISSVNGKAYPSEWASFSHDPVRWLARAPDAEAEAVWRIAQQQDRGTG